MDEERMLRVDQAAELLGTGERIEFIKIGRHVRIRRTVLLAFVAANTVPPIQRGRRPNGGGEAEARSQAEDTSPVRCRSATALGPVAGAVSRLGNGKIDRRSRSLPGHVSRDRPTTTQHRQCFGNSRSSVTTGRHR
jgi:hypothetical protein